MTQDVTDTLSEPLVEDGRRGSFLVAAGIFLSRIAGLVREIVISGLLGVGTAADSFKAALRIPNMLQNLLGEGVLSASFIPVYAKLLDEDDRESGRLAGAVAGLLCALTAVLVVLGMLLARPLTVILTPGFQGERLDLAVTLLRIMFPGIGFLVLSAWCLGILNSHRRFFLSYVAPVLWNVAQIACAVAVAIAGASEEGIATALAWGVVLGGLLQLLVQLPAVRSLVPDLRLSLDRTSRHVKSVIRRFGTVVVGRGAVQLITYVDIFLASLLAVGAVSALSYAQVLYLLPISLFGMAVAAAELPELSRIGRSGPDAMRDRLALGLDRITFYVALAVALYVFAGDVIVGALLQRGEFDAADTRLVWYVLAAFSLGLLGTTRSRLLQNGLYALNRPQIVARIAVLRVALAGIIGALLMFPFDRYAIVGSATERMGDLGLSPLPDSVRLLAGGPPRLGIVGLALGAAASSWVEYRLLRGALEWRIGPIDELTHDTRWSLIAAAGVGVLAAGIRAATDELAPVLALVVVVGASTATYLAITTTMGVTEARALVDRARRVLTG
ncbi:MAG: murein biosynthesis integral membrane protein MurJ [Acidimicrobiales bacterium]